MTSAYPLPTEVLVDRVRALAAELGAWPSRRHVMRECKVGAPRADAALATLREEGFDPAPGPVLTVVPPRPEPDASAPERTPTQTWTVHLTTRQTPLQRPTRSP